MNRKRKAIIAANEISEMRTYTLGGYSQKVLIEGKKKTNPIVLFLHGGPGFPIPFCEGCRGMFPELTEQVTLVYWDQLGCGINNHLIDESFTIDSFVTMTIDLIKYLKHDFKDNSVNIFAVSWGSILAAKAAEAIPESIHRVMVYGQVLRQLTFNDEVYDALNQSKMPKKYIDRISAIKQCSTHSLEEFNTMMRWTNRYTEGYQAKTGGKAPIGKIIRGIITSPDYSMKDFMAIVKNGYSKNKSLLIELMNLDLTETLNVINVPYLIFQGDKDIVTSTKMLSDFMETSDNKNLHFQLVMNSGHMPSAKGMDIIINTGFEFLIKD